MQYLKKYKNDLDIENVILTSIVIQSTTIN